LRCWGSRVIIGTTIVGITPTIEGVIGRTADGRFDVFAEIGPVGSVSFVEPAVFGEVIATPTVTVAASAAPVAIVATAASTAGAASAATALLVLTKTFILDRGE